VDFIIFVLSAGPSVTGAILADDMGTGKVIYEIKKKCTFNVIYNG
jgi:hypothetical protein